MMVSIMSLWSCLTLVSADSRLHFVQAQVPRNRLRSLMNDHDLRLIDVASTCRVDQSTVSRWANGQTIPRKHVIKVAGLFGVTVPYLDGWTDVDRDPAEMVA